MVSCSAEGRKNEEGCSEQWCLPSQETTTHDEPYFPGSGCTSACRMEIVKEFLVLPCLCTQLLLYLYLYCLCLNSWVLTFLPFWFSPHQGRENKRLWGAELPASVKPQHMCSSYLVNRDFCDLIALSGRQQKKKKKKPTRGINCVSVFKITGLTPDCSRHKPPEGSDSVPLFAQSDACLHK